jgi:hypothetical protein
VLYKDVDDLIQLQAQLPMEEKLNQQHIQLNFSSQA